MNEANINELIELLNGQKVLLNTLKEFSAKDLKLGITAKTGLYIPSDSVKKLIADAAIKDIKKQIESQSTKIQSFIDSKSPFQ